MKQTLFRVAAFALMALPVSAQMAAAQDTACPPTEGAATPLLENAKSLVIAGKYAEFFAAVAPGSDPSSEQMKKALEGLQKIAPEGFKTCSTLVHRQENTGLVQEVVFFGTSAAPALSLYISSAEIDGTPSVLSFLLSPDFENAFEKLR
ncbi:hypothetical protein [Paracoccus pacificus]|uniref:DUF3887 domain-containing protein n=1 Tax=Paracoccus pacificus TaxID=1463598 RepID=A0ABW4R8I1_9RHOB